MEYILPYSETFEAEVQAKKEETKITFRCGDVSATIIPEPSGKYRLVIKCRKKEPVEVKYPQYPR